MIIKIALLVVLISTGFLVTPFSLADANLGRLGAPLDEKYRPRNINQYVDSRNTSSVHVTKTIYSAEPFKTESHSLETQDIGSLILFKKIFKGIKSETGLPQVKITQEDVEISIEAGRYLTPVMAVTAVNYFMPFLQHDELSVSVKSDCLKEQCVRRVCDFYFFDENNLVPECYRDYELHKQKIIKPFGKVKAIIDWSVGDESKEESWKEDANIYAKLYVKNKEYLSEESTKIVLKKLIPLLKEYKVYDGVVSVSDESSTGCDFWRDKLTDPWDIECWDGSDD